MPEVRFKLLKSEVAVYNFTEVVINIDGVTVANPFTDARVTATLTDASGKSLFVEGFCDSTQGDVFRVRFMPTTPGCHSVYITYKQADGYSTTWETCFSACSAGNRGLLRVDSEHRWHFMWEGTGEHYFWNGTTAYYLMGWEDEEVIKSVIDRMAKLGVNRLRVLLYGRQDDHPWGTPIVNSKDFRMTLNPWLAKWPDDVAQPEFDLTRFNVDYWHKYERMLEYARKNDIIISVIFFIGAQPLPVPFGPNDEDEYRYYRYAVARFSAYSNVTWDLGNEHDFHRNRFWVDETVRYMKKADPYNHLLSVHNKPYYYSNLDMQLIQRWDAGLNRYVLDLRDEQLKSGKVVPQVIDEYGYEDLWERIKGQRSAETRRRVAWEIYMAGGYQTAGESAQGGGWVTGCGNGTMFDAFMHTIRFFRSFEWWKCSPNNELVSSYEKQKAQEVDYYYEDGHRADDLGAFCLAEEGRTYAFYLPYGGRITARIQAGTYSVKRYRPLTGNFEELDPAEGGEWHSPVDNQECQSEDIAYILQTGN